MNKETGKAELKEVIEWKQSFEFQSHPKQRDPNQATLVSYSVTGTS